LYYFNARWYDADTGRFISEDPIADPNNPNLYSYCANNPLSNTDSTGNYIDGDGNSHYEDTLAPGESPHYAQSAKPAITYGPDDSKKYVDQQGHTIVPWSYFLDGVPIEGGETGYRLLQMILESENFGKTPLVFLHGYTDHWTLWAPNLDMIANILSNSNKTTFRDLAKQFLNSKDPKEKAKILSIAQSLAKNYNMYIFDYSDSNTDSPKNIAPMFVNFLKENNIFNKTPNIIAHSMGNLVAREAIEYHGLVVHNFAMVAPPNRGSWWAKFRKDNASKYMRYDSEELAELNSAPRLQILQKNVTGTMAIFQAVGDWPVGNNYIIPGLNIPVRLYQEGDYAGEIPYTIYEGGTHSAICRDGWGEVLSNLMGFINN
jgi:pimeloyl-ACP methyl ester carboxylesterase